jgi:hypothetical protein
MTTVHIVQSIFTYWPYVEGGHAPYVHEGPVKDGYYA